MRTALHHIKEFCLTLMIAVMATVAVSCSQKEIMCPDGMQQTITVRFDWESHPEAAPKGMTLLFYSASQGGKVWRFDIAGREGGPVTLPTGTYALLAFNNDLPGIRTEALETYAGACALLKTSAGISTGCGELYSGTVPRIEVTPCGVTYLTPSGEVKECGLGVVRCPMNPLWSLYTVRVLDVKNLELLRSSRTTIDGMAMRMNLSKGTTDADECLLGIKMNEPTEGDTGFSGSATCFGSVPRCDKHTLCLDIVRNDGQTLRKTFDVTEQISTAPNPRNVVITIQGIEIPSDSIPPTPGGDDSDVGISVGVDGWNVINIDIST